jgi:hypothetical protein
VRPKAIFVLQALKLPLAALATLLAVAGIVWADLDGPGRTALATVFTGPRIGLAVLLLLPALAWFGWHMFRLAAAQRDPALRMAETIGLIARVNPARRVAEPGTPELDAVARAVNEIAQERALVLGGMDPVDPGAADFGVHRPGRAQDQHRLAIAPGRRYNHFP